MADDVQQLPPGWKVVVGSREQHDQTSLTLVAPDGRVASFFARRSSIAQDVVEDLGRAMHDGPGKS